MEHISDKSSIEWTEATWNPTTGCDRITVGCDHCYALTLVICNRRPRRPGVMCRRPFISRAPGHVVVLSAISVLPSAAWVCASYKARMMVRTVKAS